MVMETMCCRSHLVNLAVPGVQPETQVSQAKAERAYRLLRWVPARQGNAAELAA